MRNLIRSVSFSYVGYLLLLAGFAMMGLFVAVLGGGSTGAAWGLGVATVAAFVLSFGAFRFQIFVSQRTRDDDELIVHSEPLMPATERRGVEIYEATYHQAA